MIVALDTVILAHYSDHTNSQPHDALNAIRAECSQLFDAIIERDGMVDIVIPAPVIAEFTAVIRNPVPRRQMAEAFARSQVVYPLDFSTCSLAGELAGALRHSGNWPSGSKFENDFIKVDCMIMALATQRRCNYLCTENRREFGHMALAMHHLGHTAPHVVGAAEMRGLLESLLPLEDPGES